MDSTTINVTPDTDWCILQLFLLDDDTVKFKTWCIHRVRKNSMPKLCEVIEGTRTKIYLQGTICQRCVLATLQTVKLGLTKVGHQVKPLKYSEKSCISYQCTVSVQMYGHRPSYIADDEAETDVCAQKCQIAAWWLLLPQGEGKWDPLQNQHLTAT